MSPGAQTGQSSVELLGAALAVLLVGLVAFQILAAGYAAAMTDHAAQQAALALTRGEDPLRAARDALPGWPDRRVDLLRRDNEVRVRLRPPALFAAVERRLQTSSSVRVTPP